jgi:hypothetical protein
MSPEPVGRNALNGTELFVVEAASPADAAEALREIGPGVICLIAWDSRNASVDDVAVVARGLLDACSAYVCAWGPGCGRVHDIVDEEIVYDTVLRDPPLGTSRDVMTTWHEHDALSEVLWFVLAAAVPAGGFPIPCRATVAVSIAAPAWAAEMRTAFSDPERFMSVYAGDE